MKRTRQIIGILLIVFAVGALVYWETEGRGRMTTRKVLVAGMSIEKGDIITKQMLSVAGAMPETAVAGAFGPGELDRALGKEAVVEIAKNQQISEAFLRDPEEKAADMLSPFRIKGEWIDSRSSSLRRGDTVLVYSRDGSVCLGEFEVAFVKDAGGKEVVSMDSGDRSSGSGAVDHIEILTELDGYRRILKFIDDESGSLLIVQKGGE